MKIKDVIEKIENAHLSSYINKQDTYTCQYCGEKFRIKRSLVDHTFKKHRDVKFIETKERALMNLGPEEIPWKNKKN